MIARSFVLLVLLAGCDAGRPGPPPAVVATGRVVESPAVPASDPALADTADVRVQFVGNSHTYGHRLPDLVCEMVRTLQPGRTVYGEGLAVAHLDDPGTRTGDAVAARKWTHVVLQAQRISVSGRRDYSRAEGVELARRAAAGGAAVVFFAEWGLQNDPENGPRHERVYRGMAAEAGAGVKVAAVGRAWDLALADRPDLPLYAADGNHQSAAGAFLTGCVLAGRLAGRSPAPLATFPYPAADADTRKALATAAARAAERDTD